MKPKAVEFLPKEKPKRMRRLDLKTLDGTLRESASVYREFRQGTISMENAEVRRRMLSTHKEILSSREQHRQVAELIAEMKELRSGPAVAFDPDLIE